MHVEIGDVVHLGQPNSYGVVTEIIKPEKGSWGNTVKVMKLTGKDCGSYRDYAGWYVQAINTKISGLEWDIKRCKDQLKTAAKRFEKETGKTLAEFAMAHKL